MTFKTILGLTLAASLLAVAAFLMVLPFVLDHSREQAKNRAQKSNPYRVITMTISSSGRANDKAARAGRIQVRVIAPARLTGTRVCLFQGSRLVSLKRLSRSDARTMAQFVLYPKPGDRYDLRRNCSTGRVGISTGGTLTFR